MGKITGAYSPLKPNGRYFIFTLIFIQYKAQEEHEVLG